MKNKLILGGFAAGIAWVSGVYLLLFVCREPVVERR